LRAVYLNGEGREAVFLLHGVVKRGTSGSILWQAGLNPAEFLNLLAAGTM